MCKGRRTPWLGCNRTTRGWMRRVRSPCDWTPQPRTHSIPSSLSVSYTHRAVRTLQPVVPCCTGETLAAGLKLECERRAAPSRWRTTLLTHDNAADLSRDRQQWTGPIVVDTQANERPRSMSGQCRPLVSGFICLFSKRIYYNIYELYCFYRYTWCKQALLFWTVIYFIE